MRRHLSACISATGQAIKCYGLMSRVSIALIALLHAPDKERIAFRQNRLSHL